MPEKLVWQRSRRSQGYRIVVEANPPSSLRYPRDELTIDLSESARLRRQLLDLAAAVSEKETCHPQKESPSE